VDAPAGGIRSRSAGQTTRSSNAFLPVLQQSTVNVLLFVEESISDPAHCRQLDILALPFDFDRFARQALCLPACLATWR
jgi:hypothetical protein